jgi:hypothetical protein
VGRIVLPVSKVSVLFADVPADPQACTVLSKVWVHLKGVRDYFRNSELLLEGTKMIGRPSMVDEESLSDLQGPVHMLFHSQAPDKLLKNVLIYTNMQGFNIGVEVEFAKRTGGDLSHPPPGPDDKDEDDDEEEEEEDDETED